MLKTTLKITALTLTLCALHPASAFADSGSLVSEHGKWAVYVAEEKAGKVCYMMSKPLKEEGKYTKRDAVYAVITDRPADASKNVFSYVTGYHYKKGSDATVSVDGKKFTLFTQDDTAWAPDAATDGKIAEALARGSKMVVRGTSSHGTKTTDTFSLDGSGDAHQAMAEACGLK